MQGRVPGPRLHLGGRPQAQRTVPPQVAPPGLGAAGRALRGAPTGPPPGDGGPVSSPPAPAGRPPPGGGRKTAQPHRSACGPNPSPQPTAPQRRTAGAHDGGLSHKDPAQRTAPGRESRTPAPRDAAPLASAPTPSTRMLGVVGVRGSDPRPPTGARARERDGAPPAPAGQSTHRWTRA